MKTLIFDFDGTIADSFPVTLECYDEIAKENGYPPAPKIKQMDKELTKLIKEDLKISVLSFIKFATQGKKLLNSRMHKVKIFKGIDTEIIKLSKDWQIFILSSNSEYNIRKVLEKTKLKNIKIYSDSSLFGKHIVINKLIKLEKLNKSEVIYLGDETRDVDACKKIGVKVAAVTWGFNTKKLLKEHKPDFLIDKPTDLTKKFK